MVKGKVRQALRHKLGDTLVEVTLAIGIFSMVAIAAVSVVSASTSGTQNMLENTVTREEIDAQAEALRFIQAAYSASGEEYNEKDETKGKYALLWNKLNDLSLDPKTEANENIIAKMTDNSPTTCNELYTTRTETIDTSVEDVCPIGETCNSNITTITNNITIPAADKAFIINTRALGASVSNTNINDDVINNIIVSPSNENNKKEVFRPAATFPRLIYGDDTNTSYYDDSSNLISGSNQLVAAEGLYILGVKDGNTTTIVQENGTTNTISAYIDFHIRSCWFATGATRPSTISTVIRLYNPDNVTIANSDRKAIVINYDKGAEDAINTMRPQAILINSEFLPSENQFERSGYVFDCWNTEMNGGCNSSSSGNVFKPGNTYTVNPSDGESMITLYAQWKQGPKTKINYISKVVNKDDGKLYTSSTPREFPSGSLITIEDNSKQSIGHKFIKWNTKEDGSGVDYYVNDTLSNYESGTTIDLYAQWEFTGKYIQDFTLQECINLASSEDYMVFDRRDGNGYKVRYANDNGCWMTQDLRISGSIANTDSNFSTPESITLSTSGDDIITPRIIDRRQYISYNYCAAKAGNTNSCSQYNDDSYNIDIDICPANWKIPNMNEMSSIRNDTKVFNENSVGNLWWTSTTLGPADNEQGMLQCVLERTGDEFYFDYNGTHSSSCRSGNRWWGYFRKGLYSLIRCKHK